VQPISRAVCIEVTIDCVAQLRELRVACFVTVHVDMFRQVARHQRKKSEPNLEALRHLQPAGPVPVSFDRSYFLLNAI